MDEWLRQGVGEEIWPLMEAGGRGAVEAGGDFSLPCPLQHITTRAGE